MNIQEYKDRKDKLRLDIENLIQDFNRDLDTVVLSIDIEIDIHRSIGFDPSMSGIDCKITTEIDQ